MRCYEFQYPSSWSLKEHLSYNGRPSGWNSIREENKGWVISTSIESMAAFSSNRNNPEKRSLEDFVMFRARAMFCADGPNGSHYIKEAVSQTEFTNPSGLKGLELFLKQVHETHLEDEEKTKIEEKTIGPVYAISISQPHELQRVLLFEINDDGPTSPEQRALLQDIVTTVRILQ
jgi:hypothetical protein